MIIDTHCHAGLNWFEPLDVLLYQMKTNGVSKAVLIQHRGVFDNSYLIRSANKYPKTFKVCGIVNPNESNPIQKLSQLKSDGVSGIRLNNDEMFLGVQSEEFIRAAGDLGMVISYHGTVEFFASNNFKNIIEKCPETKIIMEHLAGVGFLPRPYTLYKSALECSVFQNAFIKIPGLGEFSKRPKVLQPSLKFEEIPPFIEMAYEKFGADRMMWGSDFPPCAGREGYKNALNGVKHHEIFRSIEDQNKVMGQTAAKVWGFD